MHAKVAATNASEALVCSLTKASLSVEQDKEILDRYCSTLAGQIESTIQEISKYESGASALNKARFEHLQTQLHHHKETVYIFNHIVLDV